MGRVNYISRGVGPTVIFLHGIGGGAESFAHQVDAFAAAGYQAVAWDMPGYGSYRPLNEVTFPALCDALADVFVDLSIATAHVAVARRGAPPSTPWSGP